MRTSGTVALALGLVGLVATTTHGQSTGTAALVRNPGVRQELKVSDDQARKLDALISESRARYRDEIRKVQDLPKDRRREKIEALIRSSDAEVRKGLAGILEPAQAERLEQIRLQQSLPYALKTPRIEAALKLTDEQKAKVREVTQRLDQLTRDVMADDPNNRRGASESIATLRREASEAIFTVLTDAQKRAWKDLAGEPFQAEVVRQNPD